MILRTSAAPAADLNHWAIGDLDTAGFHEPEPQPAGPSIAWTGAGDTANVFFHLDRPEPARVVVELVASGAASAPCWDELVVRLDGEELETVARTSRGGSLLLTGYATAHPVVGTEHVLELQGPLRERLVGEDRRRLGVALRAFSVQVLGPAEDPATGTPIAVDAAALLDGEARWSPTQGVSVTGLHATEIGPSGRPFAWTGAHDRVRLMLPVTPDRDDRVVVELRAQGSAGPEPWVRTRVLYDGVQCEVTERWQDGPDLVLRARGTIDRSVAAGELVVIAPASSVPGDPRALGIALVEARAWPASEAPDPQRSEPPTPGARRRLRVAIRRSVPAPVRRVIRRARTRSAPPPKREPPSSPGEPSSTIAPSSSGAPSNVGAPVAELDELREAVSLIARDLSVLREIRHVLHHLIDRVATLERRLDDTTEPS